MKTHFFRIIVQNLNLNSDDADEFEQNYKCHISKGIPEDGCRRRREIILQARMKQDEISQMLFKSNNEFVLLC